MRGKKETEQVVTSLQHYCCVCMFIVMLVVKVKKLCQLKNVRISRSFLTHSLPRGRGGKGGKGGGEVGGQHISITLSVQQSHLTYCSLAGSSLDTNLPHLV